MASPKLPAPPVKSVTFQVEDIEWDELVFRLDYLSGQPVEVRLGFLGGEDLLDLGGVFEVITRPGESQDEEVRLCMEGSEAFLTLRQQEVVRAEATTGYFGIELVHHLYLTISYFSRVSEDVVEGDAASAGTF